MGDTLFISTTLGKRLAILTTYRDYSCGITLNGPGAAQVTFYRWEWEKIVKAVSLPEKLNDYILEIWTSTPGNSRPFFVGLISGKVLRREGSVDIVTLVAVGLTSLLERRIVAYAAKEAQSDKTGYAGDLMKAVVRENLGSSAAASRQISYLSVEEDAAQGATISMAFAWKPVDEVVAKMAEASYNAGTRLFYGITPGWNLDGELVATFRTATLWGTDSTSTDDTFYNPVQLRVETGSIVEPQIVYNWEDYATYAYVGGQGEEEEREIIEIETNTALVGNPNLARKEVFVDARDVDNTAGLTDRGDSRLKELLPKDKFSGKIVEPQTQTTWYGKTWSLGDILSAGYGNSSFRVLISGAYLSRSQSGERSLSAEMEVL